VRKLIAVALLAASVCLAESGLDLRELDRVDVSPRSGALELSHDDLVLGHGAEAFALRRHYAHRAGRLLDFGRNWATCLGVRVVLREGGGYVRASNGAFLPLEQLDAHTWASTRGAVWVDASDRQQPTIYGMDGRAYVCGPRGWLRTIRRADVEVQVERDGQGLVQALRGPWGELVVERVDGVLQALVLPSGARVTYTRGEFGALVAVDDGTRRVSYGYDAALRLSALADGAAAIGYDEVGRVVELAGPRVLTRTLSYALEGDVLEVRDVQGAERVTHRFDVDGRWAETTVDGATSRRTYDARGNVQSFERGAQTVRLERDARGRVIRRQRGATLTRTTYVGGSDLPRERISGGERVRFVRDAAGRLTATVGPRGATRAPAACGQARYDADGRRVGRALADGGREAVLRSARGTRVETRDAAGQLVRAVERDLRGRVVRIEELHGQVQTLSWSPQGQLVGCDASGAAPVRLSYDEQGRLSQLADSQGTLASYSYPDAHTVVVEDAAAGTTTLTHDSDGRVVAVQRGDALVRRVYNEGGRLVAEDTPAGRVRYRYDAAGNPIQVRSAAGTVTQAFDAAGNATRVRDAQGFTLEASFDAAGRRTALRAPWGEVRYTRDAAGRLTAVTLPDGGTIRLELLADGRRSAVHFPNGVSTRYDWTGALLTGQRTTRGEALLDERSLRYDDAGRLVELRDLDGATSYAYDAEGRLVSATRDGETQRFAWDARGNRVDLGAVDAGSRLQAEGLSYDAWGRLTAQGGKRLRYDGAGRLVGATLADGRELSWSYDPAGRRVRRTLDGASARFVHDGEQLAAVYGEAGLETAFVHGDRLDETLAVLHDGAWHFPLADQVQSVVGLTDAAGQEVGRARYAPFGAVEQSTLPSWLGLGFSGRPADPELGWVDLRARFYAPELARFTTPDPLGQRGGVNLYAYVSGNPLSFNDPRGTSENDPTQAELDALVQDQYRELLSEVPDWVADEIEASGLDPLVALPVLAEHAESEGWIDDELRGQIQTVVVSVVQARLGTSIPTPIDADDPDEVAFNALVSLTILAATNGNPYVAAATFAGGLLLDFGLDYYNANIRSFDLGPGHVTRRPDGTYTSSFAPGVIFTSPEQLQEFFDRGYDPNGDGKFDYEGGRTPDLAQEARRQDAFQITTVLPDGSFMSAHFPGVLFGPDQMDGFFNLLLRGEHLNSGVCLPGSNTGFHHDSLERLLEFMQLNTVLNTAIAEALGLDVFLVQDDSGLGGAANLRYSTRQFPTERYASLQLLVEDATRAAQEEITWNAGEQVVIGWNELPAGAYGPPSPILGSVDGYYETPLLPGERFDRLPEAFAAMDALYAELEIGPYVHTSDTPAFVPAGQSATGGLTSPWQSPYVEGLFSTRVEVVRAYRSQPQPPFAND